MNYDPSAWRIVAPALSLFLFFLGGTNASGQSVLSADATSLSLGKILAPEIPGTLNYNNPACIGGIDQKIYAIGHIQPFLVKEIGVNSMYASVPVANGSFAGSLSEYGIEGFRHFSAQLIYGMPLGESLSAGVAFHYSTIASTGKFNYIWSLHPAIGLRYRKNKKTTLGAVIHAPLSAGNSSGYGPVIPFQLAIGITKEVQKNLFMVFEICSNHESVARGKAGIAYQAGKNISIRAGYHNDPMTYTFGISYNVSQFVTEFAASWTPGTGVTPAIQISHAINQNH